MRTIVLASIMLQGVALSAQGLNPTRVGLHRWANGIDRPVAITNAGDDRLFVVEEAGRIRIITDSMQVAARPYLDIRSRVNSVSGEQGLLGLAFDPHYAENGYFYVNYIFGAGNGATRISRFQVTSDPDSADAGSEVVLYTWPQPYANHNGGCLQFGPDGYLYCGFGDGGSSNDPEGHAQTLADPLGDIDPHRRERPRRHLPGAADESICGRDRRYAAGDLGQWVAQPVAVQLRPGAW
ncbi:MAG: PQQ-dependent sugar dehydrogenase [Flavobacteriales bacterium]